MGQDLNITLPDMDWTTALLCTLSLLLAAAVAVLLRRPDDQELNDVRTRRERNSGPEYRPCLPPLVSSTGGGKRASTPTPAAPVALAADGGASSSRHPPFSPPRFIDGTARCMGLLDAARQPHGVNEKGLFYAFCEILIDKTPVALRRIFIHLWNARFAEWKNTPESGILFAHGPHSTYYTTSIGSGKIQEASKVVQELDQDPTVKKGSRVKLVRSDDQAEFFSTVSESEWKEAKGIGQIKLKDKLFPKNSDGPPSKYQVEVFASQIYDVNFPPRAAASNDGAKKRVLAGNTEDWDLTLVLWALLNSAYELCGNTTDQQMLALKRTLENKDKDQLGVRNVRNCAFGHVQRASMPWQDFVKSVERLLAAMDAIDDVLDLREAADGCRATLEGDIVRALSECSGPEALQQETARTQLEMYQSQLKQWEELEAKRRFTVHSSGDGGFTAGQITAPVTINNYYYSGHTSDPSRGESGDGTQGGGRGGRHVGPEGRWAQTTIGYACVAIQPPPVFIGRHDSHGRLWRRLKEIENGLRGPGGDEWRDQHRIPVLLRSAEESELFPALRKWPVRVLVWCAMGVGWESSAADDGSTQQHLDPQRIIDHFQQHASCTPPSIVVVSMKFGAQKAADFLAARLKRSKVVWIKMDILQEDADFFFRVVMPIINIAEEEHATKEEIRKKIHSRFAERCETGISAAPGVDPWEYLPNSSDGGSDASETVENFVDNGAPPVLETNVVRATLSILDCDIKHVQKVTLQLESELRANVLPRGGGWNVLRICGGDWSRCRAVAEEVCLALAVRSNSAFERIFRTDTVDDIPSLSSTMEKLLLWVDMTRVMEWREFLEMRGLRNIIILLTSPNDDSDDAEDLEELSKNLKFEEEILDMDVKDVKASELHGDLKLLISDTALKGGDAEEKRGREEGETRDLLDLFSLAELADSISGLFPGEKQIAALFEDDDRGIIVRWNVRSVGNLHEMRDVVLQGDLGRLLTEALEARRASAGVELHGRIRVDLSSFAEQYERCILLLDKLTSHQQKKLEECEGVANIHVQAPAGAGKTFVALHRMLKLLKGNSRERIVGGSASSLDVFVSGLDWGDHPGHRPPDGDINLMQRALRELGYDNSTMLLSEKASADLTEEMLKEVLRDLMRDDGEKGWRFFGLSRKFRAALERRWKRKSTSLSTHDAAPLLFVARNPALCLFVAKWMNERLSDRNSDFGTKDREEMLARVHLLCRPFDAGPRAISIKGSRVELTSIISGEAALSYSLVVVDEVSRGRVIY